MTRGFRARLYPNRQQMETFRQTFGSVRFVHNYFLEEKTRAYREEGKSLSYNRMSAMLTELKHQEEYAWLNDCDSMALQESLRDLERSYQNFFRGNARYPLFHSRRGKQSYRTRNQNNGIRICGNRVRIPKIGWVKYRGLPSFEGRILHGTVTMEPSGKVYLSLCVECPEVILPNGGGMVGLDVGLTVFCTDSEGNTVENPRTLKKHEKKLAREQRRLSRKKKGGRNREKQRCRVAKEHEKVRNIRMDFLHKETSRLASENQVVCVEDLNVKGMLRNHHLAKAISDVSWSEFFRLLAYKMEEHGGVLVRVPAFYPSSQTCSACGYRNPLVRDLSVREWMCPGCGTRHERDANAAKNILRKGLEMLETA